MICLSQSPWCNTVVLVRKKDGGLQFCIDFCRLNSQTKKDAYPLPQMQETMESMVGTRFFSTMDLKSGFWQVKMAKDSQQYTAFMVGSMGVYEFLRMPYGLCNTLATFQNKNWTVWKLHQKVITEKKIMTIMANDNDNLLQNKTN